VNVALLVLLPLALAGFASGALVGWLVQAAGTSAPTVPPAFWRVLPPALLLLAAGCWLGARRAAAGGRPLSESSRWLGVAAAGALLAPWLLEVALPVPEPVTGLRLSLAAALSGAAAFVACGAAFSLLAEARAVTGRAGALAAVGALLLGVGLAWPAGAPARWLGLPAVPTALHAALAAALAGVLAAALSVDERPAPAGRARSAAAGPTLLLAVFGALLVALLLQVRQFEAQVAAVPVLLAQAFAGAGVLGLLLAAGQPESRADGGPLAPSIAWRLLVASAALLVSLGSLELHATVTPAAVLLVALGLSGACVATDGVSRPLAPLLAGASLPLLLHALRSSDGQPPDAQVDLRGALVVGAAAALLGTLAAGAPRDGRDVLRRSAQAVLALAALAALPFVRLPQAPWRKAPEDVALLAREEGLRHLDVIVGRPDGRAVLRRDGAPLVGDELGELHARRLGRLAAALAPGAQSAALLLRDDGQLFAALAATTPAHVTCVEPDAALVVLQPDVDWEAGQDARGGPPTLVIDDPRAWLLRHPRELDLVVANLFRPDESGAETWLTAEHFLALRGALREGGVAVVALPLHLLPWPALQHVGTAFLQAFPDARLFVGSLLADAPVAVLAGGLTTGVPGARALDELLGASPSAAGLNGAPDLYDLYVCDGWTLAARWSDAPPATLERPLGAWLSAGRAADAPLLARLNLRLLADLAAPLDTSSLAARPTSDKDDRRLGAELTARSAALAGLLVARSSQLALDQAAAGELSSDERQDREAELSAALLYAWRSAPGHLDVRDALLERAARLTREGRHESAAKLLDAAVQVLDDPRLASSLGASLLRLQRTDQALELLQAARARAPADAGVLVPLAAALLAAGRDAEAHVVLEQAARAVEPLPLPPSPAAALGLLRADTAAVAPARRLLQSLPADDPWSAVLARLLRLPPPGSPPP